EAAAQRSDKKPWFLYCNPRAQLLKEIERSSRVLKNSAIKCLSLFVGSMGLSGSTRMQASTVLMASVGWAIQYGENQETIKRRLQQFRQTWEDLSLFPLGKFTEKEAVCYQKSEYVIYNTKSFGVTVLTDTTERAPTFALSPFENVSNPADPPGWCYLSVPSAANSEIAWHHILKRKPRCLEWKEIKSFVGLEYLNGFTIGQNCLAERTRKTKAATQHLFDIEVVDQGFQFNFEEHNWRIRAPELTFFEHNLLLKLVLNIHSTLVMGILGRFESNLMTYVKPSNFKLIDRSIRYVQQLSTLEGNAEPDYSLVAETLFALKETLPPDEPIVLRVLEALKSR
ncbi:MAG: hypothetical protein O7C75_08830, partial [Verrucomicrobia bacterium]|nr:hypothetical protein [Verrucomicrobiota bacterium]